VSFSGELWWLSVREGKSGQNEAGEGDRVRAGLKRELGDVGRRCGQGSRRACARVSGGSRGGRSRQGVPRRSEREREQSERVTALTGGARCEEGERGLREGETTLIARARLAEGKRERVRERVRAKGTTPTGGSHRAEGKGAGTRSWADFWFFFYSEFSIPFLFIYSIEFKSNQTTHLNSNISNMCINQKQSLSSA
jgi:hypothetical protein